MKKYIGIGLVCIGIGFVPFSFAQTQPASTTKVVNKPDAPSSQNKDEATPNLQSLSIQDGKVYINGQEQNASALPKDLKLDGVTLDYNFYGGFVPVFEINGKSFTLDNGKLISFKRQFKSEEDLGSFMEQQAAQYNQVRRNLVPLENNSQMVNIRDEAPDLFSRMRREQWLEYDSQQLAVKIRMTPEGVQRVEMTRELRQKLGMIFDLRQQNLEEEIRQLNNQLILLRGRLRDKELEKDRIIEARVQELIHG